MLYKYEVLQCFTELDMYTDVYSYIQFLVNISCIIACFTFLLSLSGTHLRR